MSDAFVADCSVGIGWVHPGQANDLTRFLLQSASVGMLVHVPSIWHLEMANAMIVAVRRKLMTEAHRLEGLELLAQLGIVVDNETSNLAFSSISSLAARYYLSVYDASYLELAVRKSIPLGSRDEPLRAAALKMGVTLL